MIVVVVAGGEKWEEENVKLCEEVCVVEEGGRHWREGESGGSRRWMVERGGGDDE